MYPRSSFLGGLDDKGAALELTWINGVARVITDRMSCAKSVCFSSDFIEPPDLPKYARKSRFPPITSLLDRTSPRSPSQVSQIAAPLGCLLPYLILTAQRSIRGLLFELIEQASEDSSNCRI